MHRLVLLPKPGKLAGDPSAYRPICLLDTVGNCWNRSFCRGSVLLDNQFGFREGRSTVDAIRAVTKTAEIALQKNRNKNPLLCGRHAGRKECVQQRQCVLHHLGVPVNICWILESYFQNRGRIYDTEEGERSYKITAGITQGSILGPVLWNATYDGVLRLKLAPGLKLIGFVDDITLVVYGESIEEVELTATHAIGIVQDWARSPYYGMQTLQSLLLNPQ